MTAVARWTAALAGAAVALVPALVAPDAPPASAASHATSGPAATDGDLRVAFVVPVVVPPESGGILDAESLGEYTADGGLLDRQLDAVEEWPVTLAIDPRIVVSIRLLGSTAPDEVADWLDRLEALPHERFALAYADADVASLAALGATELGRPLGFGFAVDPGRFGPAVEPAPVPTGPTTSPAPVPTPTGSPDPGPTPPDEEPDGPPPLPTDDDLQTLDVTFEHIAWPAAGTVHADALGPLADAGVETLLLHSSQLVRDRGPHVDLGPVRALVADSALSELASTAAFAPGITESDDAGAALLDALEGRAGGPDAAAIVAFDRRTASLPSRVAAVLDDVAGIDGLRLAPLSEAAGIRPVAAELAAPAESDTAAERRASLETLLSTFAAETRFASVAADPSTFRAERRIDLLAVLSTGWHVRPVGWEDATQAFLERSREITSSVQIAEGSDLLVLSNSTGLPVTVTNALDVPVTVVVTARPLRPLLRIPDGPVEVTVEPGSSHTAYIPAEAITNGRVPVQLTMRSTTGVEIGGPQIVRADLQAQWETVGVIVLIGLAIVFAVGIVRNIVVRRRRWREDDSTDTDTESAQTEGDA